MTIGVPCICYTLIFYTITLVVCIILIVFHYLKDMQWNPGVHLSRNKRGAIFALHYFTLCVWKKFHVIKYTSNMYCRKCQNLICSLIVPYHRQMWNLCCQYHCYAKVRSIPESMELKSNANVNIVLLYCILCRLKWLGY